MESFFVRFKNSLVLIVLLLAQTIGLATQVRRPVAADQPDGRQVYLLRLWANAAFSPVERLLQRASGGVRATWSNYLDLRHTRERNATLEREIAALRLEQAAFAEDAIQGHRLQAMLAFQQHYVAKTVAAQVIGTSGSDLSRILTLDKGSADGLKPDMAVITPDGAVGKLRDVFPHTAQLLLLNDPTSGAGVLLQTTRIRAIVHGTPTGRIVIGNLTADSRIKVGDTVLTSGGDLVYPRGLPVGTIESIAPDPERQPYTAIVLKPAANLAQLEEVLVITEMQTGVPAQAQQDLAQGASTAKSMASEAAARAAAQAAMVEESKRAADLLAERLPSLHDGDAPADLSASPADASGPAKEPGGTVPKPLPTLHADRYTPGSTLPAAQLTPGAKAPEARSPTGSDGEPVPAAPVARRARKVDPEAVAPMVPSGERLNPKAPPEAMIPPAQEPPR